MFSSREFGAIKIHQLGINDISMQHHCRAEFIKGAKSYDIETLMQEKQKIEAWMTI